jgi:hypothetical protein
MQSAVETPQIIYKRTSSWWLATCYLLGSLALLLWAVISLLGAAVSLGKDGVVALHEASEEQEQRRAIASYVKDDIKLTAFNVVSSVDRATLSVTIKNDSQYSIEHVRVEIAHLDSGGLPLFTRDEWLSDLGIIFPGDTAHSHTQFALKPDHAASDYAVRISRFDVVGDGILQDICSDPKISPQP